MIYRDFFKRILDFILSFLLILVMFPVFILLFLISSFSTKELGLFRQERIGFKRQVFYIYKFKSMTGSNMKDFGIATLSQSRITKFGSFIRKTHLDELPQFFLVVFGKMSLIGPRPELPIILTGIEEKDLDVCTSVRPGLISPASLKYNREEDLLSIISNPMEHNKNEIFPIITKSARL